MPKHVDDKISLVKKWITNKSELKIIDPDHIYCTVCKKKITCRRKFHVKQHLETIFHKTQKQSSLKLVQQLYIDVPENHNFLGHTFIEDTAEIITPKEEPENDSMIEVTETVVFSEYPVSHQSTSVTVEKQIAVTEQTDTSVQKDTVDPHFSLYNKSVDKLVEILDVRSKEIIELQSELRNRKMSDEDDVDAFFKSIALMVKKFPPHLQTEAKLQALALIADMEKRSFNNETE